MGKQAGGFSLEQNNNTGRRGPADGRVPDGGRSWGSSPDGSGGGGVAGGDWAKARLKIFGEEEAWQTQSFPGLRIDFPNWR